MFQFKHIQKYKQYFSIFFFAESVLSVMENHTKTLSENNAAGLQLFKTEIIKHFENFMKEQVKNLHTQVVKAGHSFVQNVTDVFSRQLEELNDMKGRLDDLSSMNSLNSAKYTENLESFKAELNNTISSIFEQLSEISSQNSEEMDSLGVKLNTMNTSTFEMLNTSNTNLDEISSQNSFSFVELNYQMRNMSKETEHILEDTYEIKITNNKILEAAVNTRKVASEIRNDFSRFSSNITSSFEQNMEDDRNNSLRLNELNNDINHILASQGEIAEKFLDDMKEDIKSLSEKQNEVMDELKFNIKDVMNKTKSEILDQIKKLKQVMKEDAKDISEKQNEIVDELKFKIKDVMTTTKKSNLRSNKAFDARQ